jgi:hypothetical protein
LFPLIPLSNFIAGALGLGYALREIIHCRIRFSLAKTAPTKSSKSEYLNPKQTEAKQNSNQEIPKLEPISAVWNIVYFLSRFEFVSNFKFRASDLCCLLCSSLLTPHPSRRMDG